MSDRTPPRLAQLLLRLCLAPDVREVIEGDLAEAFHEQLAAGGSVRAARRRYWQLAVASIVAIKRPRRNASASAHSEIFAGITLDLRSVLRAFRRSPGYAAVAVLSLAIGIGANTAIVSIARQVLMQPLPVEQPEELRLLYWTPNSDQGIRISQRQSTGFRDAVGTYYRSNYSWPVFKAIRDAAGASASIAGFTPLSQMTVMADQHTPQSATGLIVTGNFFATIRPPMALGRPLDERDDAAGAPAVAVLGYAFWQSYFGGSPNVVGQVIDVSGSSATIVGVTAGKYRSLSAGGFGEATDVTLPMAALPQLADGWVDAPETVFGSRTLFWMRAIARVPNGTDEAVTTRMRPALQHALADGALTAAQAAASQPRLFPGARGLDSLRASATPQLRILSAVAAIVLLIACLNVAGLMVARGVSRQRELAVRRSLGASRLRIVRALILESLMLSVAGGAAGAALAFLAAPALKAMTSAGLGTTAVTVSFDRGTLLITMAIACATGLLAGLIPAIRFSGPDASWLAQRSSSGVQSRLFVGRALLALQIAVSLPLVAGAGLFLRTLYNLANVDIGFNPNQLVLFDADPTRNGRAPERVATVFPRVLERIEAIDGVTSATLVENPLLSGWESDTNVLINGEKAHLYVNSVGPRYFETMGATLISGRAISPSDGPGSPRVAVINQTAARRYFHSESPLGATITNNNRVLVVVGVMADAKYDQIRSDAPPTMLQSYLQRPVDQMTVVVRAAGAQSTLEPAIRRAVAEADPSLPIDGYRTQVSVIERHIGKERVFARLLTVFGAFALLLACIGLHGVTSYAVARRTNEFGIRLALGAQRQQVLGMVLRQVAQLAVAGVAIGLPLAWLIGPFVSTFLYGLAPTDKVTLAGAALIMVVIAISAGLGPARRAARMEALQALRME